MNRYNLPETKLSPHCYGKWDVNSKKFLETNSLDAIRCCLDTCRKNVEFCNIQCGSDTRCQKHCKEIEDDCKGWCLRMPSTALTIMKHCIHEHECELWDLECLNNKKEVILECCKKKCVTKQDIDCEQVQTCEDAFNFIRDLYSKNESITSVQAVPSMIISMDKKWVGLIVLLMVCVIMYIVVRMSK